MATPVESLGAHPDVTLATTAMLQASGGVTPADGLGAMRRAARARHMALSKPAPPVASIEEFLVGNAAAGRALRVYRPKDGRSHQLPSLLYLHGGGFVAGDLSSSHTFCSEVANACPCVVASLDYRLAPEHPFPAALDDAIEALRFLASGNVPWVDGGRLAIGGDSAGGALAAAAAHALHAEVDLRHQVLIYPILDLSADSESYRRFADVPWLNAERMRWYIDQYAPRESDRLDPRASPLLASSFGRCPPTLMIAAGLDPLVEEGRAYAARLRVAGVPVHYISFDDHPHGFVSWGRYCRAAGDALDLTCVALRAAFIALDEASG